MAEGRSKRLWDHTAAVMCLLANCHRDPKKRRAPYMPDDFHPYGDAARRSTRGIKITPATIGVLKVFVDPQKLAARERANARRLSETEAGHG